LQLRRQIVDIAGPELKTVLGDTKSVLWNVAAAANLESTLQE
jgi:hypothetical protein